MVIIIIIITTAGVCKPVYVNECITEPTAVGIDEHNDKFSLKSIQWMEYLKLPIQHACNGGEVKLRVGNKLLKVDGYSRSTNTVYQFHGCYYHGCRVRYPDTVINTKNGRYMTDLYAITLANDKLLKQYYNLVTIWEHDFKGYNISITPPLSLRDAFYGGRTEPFKLLKQFKDNGSRGKYIDVCSLYPTVMYYDRYPVGHPTKIYNPTKYDPNWYGMVHCKVLPPRGLYLPVLPTKVKTKDSYKLIFGLCQECMININGPTEMMGMPSSTICKHPDMFRAITGYWTTVELEVAINQGYKIMQIYEVHNFTDTSTDLWKKYIRKFLKIKLETSPCSNEKEYRAKARQLGIELEDISFNKGLRFISKLCLNSLWGKFGQADKLFKKEYVTDPGRFYKMITDDTINIQSITFLNTTQYQRDSNANERDLNATLDHQ